MLQIEHDKAFVRRRFSNFKFSAVAGVDAQEGLGDESELDILKGSIFSDFLQIKKYCKCDFSENPKKIYRYNEILINGIMAN